MSWALLIIVLVAAGLGVLGAVLKIAAAIILGLVLVVMILVTIAWFGFRHWAQDLQRRSQVDGGASGSYEVTGYIRTEESPPGIPGDEA